MADRSTPPAATRTIALAGGLVFVASLVYFAVSYLGRFGTPVEGALDPGAIAIDVVLFSVFALHHSIFARTRFKLWVHTTAPPELERSIYVWIASGLFVAVCAWWQPVAGAWWTIDGPAAWVLIAIQATAGLSTLAAARRLDFLALAGVRQVWQQRTVPDTSHLHDRDLYAIVRHPIYLAWLVLVWCSPVMTGTRLVFAITSSVYLFLAVPHEERDLVRAFGEPYVDYQRRVRWRILPFIY